MATLNYEDDFEKDCSNYKFKYIPDTLEPTSRTIAIGDIHGDLKLAIEFLTVAKCIQLYDPLCDKEFISVDNKKYIWIGNDTQVVQVGDQVDRCRPVENDNCNLPHVTINDEASDIKILKFYSAIDKLAQKDGGRLISLLGNHELMNVMGNMDYVSFMGLLEFNSNVDMTSINIDMDNQKLNEIVNTGLQNRKNAFSNKFTGDRTEALNEYLACSRTSAIIIGGLLFVHGGLIKKMANAYNIKDLNRIVRKWLLGKLNDEKSDDKRLLYTKQEKQMDKNPSFSVGDRVYQIIKSKNSIFWNRVLGYLDSDLLDDELDSNELSIKQKKCDSILNELFETVNISGIVIGHTPQMSEKYNGINSACDGKVWRVDIGASSAFDVFKKMKRVVQVLEIKYDNNKPKFNVLT
jgi:hypothetical protein